MRCCVDSHGWTSISQYNNGKKKKIDIFDFAHASQALNLVVESYRSVHQWPCLAYLSKPHW